MTYLGRLEVQKSSRLCYNIHMRILIVGNILKDVYLSLDERQNKFETE
jgi:hypothetical protein